MFKQSYRHSILFVMFLLILFQTSCTTDPMHRVLVIGSLEAEYKGYINLESRIRNEFEKQHIDADVRVFFLDCETYEKGEEIERVNGYLDTLDDWTPDILLVLEDQATYSLLEGNHSLVQKVPIIFSGVNFPNKELLKRHPNVTGWWDRPEYMKVAEMVDELFGPMQINVWLDKTYISKHQTRRLLEELDSAGITRFGLDTFTLHDDGTYSFGSTSSTIPRSEYAIRIPPLTSTFNFLNSRASFTNQFVWTRGGLAKYAVFVQGKRDISSVRLGLYVNNATFTVVNEGFGFGEGILGGYLTLFQTQVNLSVASASEVLKGRDIRSIPIQQPPKEYVVDWTEMERWKIGKERIPNNYRIINMPFSERYKSALILVGVLGGIFILLLFAILIYLYQRENRNKKKAQIKQKQGERFLSLAISGGKVFAFQLSRGMFNFDQKFCQFIGTKEGCFTMEQFREYLYPDDRERFNQEVTTAYAGNLTENISRVRCDFDGKGYQWWEYRYTYNEEEELFSGLCLNIQKTKEEEQELIDARKKAEESDNMKSAFLANMSHEIRTPLNAIVGFSNIIGADEVDLEPEDRAEFLRLINSNCELLLKLINDILDLSRIESGHMSFAFSNCNLTELIGNIYSTHQLMMPQGVELKKEVPAVPVFLYTDEFRLNQVITNFINNAVKFTPSGSIKIGYTAHPSDNTIHITVEDTGVGIPMDKQLLVFDRFNKLDEFAQGTGLGLAICQVIIKQFQGHILLSSTPGKGSCFTIVLPCLME